MESNYAIKRQRKIEDEDQRTHDVFKIEHHL